MSRRHGVRLRGADAGHLYEERPDRPRHTVKVLHLDPAVRVTAEQVLEHVQARVAGLPVLRRVLRRHRLHHPWWEELDTVDVRDHLDVEELPAGPVHREAAVARVLEQVLDRDRPLWRLRLLDAPDGQALVLAASHALLDGHVAARVLTGLFGPDAVVQPREGVPLGGPVAELAALVRGGAGLVPRGLRSRAARRGAPVGEHLAAPFSGAAAPWNSSSPSGRRVYAEVELPLATVLRVARTGGATLTAVVLALVGGAVRPELARPDAWDLVSLVPATTRRPTDTDTAANLVAVLLATSGSATADPVLRLRRVAASLGAARARLQLGDELLLHDAQDAYPVFHAAHLASGLVGRVLRRPAAALVVSTVRGPSGPLSVAGAPVRSIVSGGVLAADLGLNVIAWSSRDVLTLGIVARADGVRDVRALAARVATGLDELAEGHPTG